jgi:nitroreductase
VNRRDFIRGLGAGALGVAAIGLTPSSAAASDEVRPRSPAPVGPPLGQEEEGILAHAALAPSGHNTQPWVVRVAERRRWVVGVDPERRLPKVDPADRELRLAIGAFLENLAVAAGAVGLAAEIQLPDAPDAGALARVRLAPGTPGDERELERIRLRRTLRSGQRNGPIRADDRRALLAPHGDGAAWLDAASREARWLREAAVEAFRRQTWRDDAQLELAAWLRFSDEEVARHRDGLTPAALEVGALAAWYMRHFMDRKDVLKRRFREAGIDAAARQVTQGAGWLVVTSRDESTPALVDAGRRFERMALRLRERSLGAHPMSQVLEEDPWRTQAARELGLAGIPQLLLRVGYVADYPEPISPRRPPAAFTRVG